MKELMRGLALTGALVAVTGTAMADLPKAISDLPKDAWVDYRYVAQGTSAISATDNWAGTVIMNEGDSNIRVTFPVPVSPGGRSLYNGNYNYGMAFQSGAVNVLSMPAENADMGYNKGYLFHGKKYKDITSAWLAKEMKASIENTSSAVPFAYRGAQKLDLPYKEDAVYYAAQSVNGGIVYKYTLDFMFPDQKDRAYSLELIQNNTPETKDYVNRAITMWSNYMVPSARPADYYLDKTDKVEIGNSVYYVPKDFRYMPAADTVDSEFTLVRSQDGRKVTENRYLRGDDMWAVSYILLDSADDESKESLQKRINESLETMQRTWRLSDADPVQTFTDEEITGPGRYRAMINHDGMIGIYVETYRADRPGVDTWTRMISPNHAYDVRAEINQKDFDKHKLAYRDILQTVDMVK